MELFGSNINLFSRKRESVPGIPGTTAPNTPENQSVKGKGSGTYAANIEYVGSQERALKIAAFYRCLELRANTMAQLRPEYQTKNAEGGNFAPYNRGVWRHLNYLMQVAPNPVMSAFEMWRQVEVEVVLRGNAYILIERDVFDQPDRLWLATSGSYDMGTDTYALVFNAERGPVSVRVDSRDVVHIANTFRRRGGHDGISTLEYARDMLSLSKTLDKSALEQAAKGGRVKLIIGEEKPAQGAGTLAYGLMNKDEQSKYAREINNLIYQQDVIALRGLDKVQNISMSASDMQLFDQRQFGVAEICRMLSTPRSLAMDGSNSSYKTPEADRLDFLMNCIQPKRCLIEKEMNRKLLGEKDFGKARIHLCELPLMMFDKKTQADIDLMHLQTGWSINDVRAQYDLPSVENGDEPMASANLMTMKALMAKSEAATQLQPGNYTVGNPPAKEGEES